MRGVALPEVVVAILLIAVGVLAWAGSFGSIHRSFNDGGLRAEAGAVGEAQLERLIAMGSCASTAGSGRVNAFGLRWIRQSTSPLNRVQVWVRTPTARGSRVDSLVGSVPCGM